MKISKLRNTLLEYDFELLNAKSELALISAKVEKLGRSKSKAKLRQYTEWRIAEEKTITYINKLTNGLNQTLEYLETLLEEYNITERKIFKDYYLKQMVAEEISQKENRDIEEVKQIIEKLEKDFTEE